MISETHTVARSPGSTLGLVPVDAGNWRNVVRVTPRSHQERFVAPVAHYLCLCHYGQVWHPLAVMVDQAIVGHLMWAVDDVDGSRWIGGVVIDASVQGRRIGRTALEALIAWLGADADCREVALSYDPENEIARRLYASLGFVETGEREDDEIVARRRIR